MPSPTSTPAAQASRPLPGFQPGADQPGYPEEALAAGLSGRVLVEFGITAGRATGITVATAQAEPILQQAAVAIIADTYFDLHDRNNNPSDPRPFFVSVQFCLDYCGELRPFPGYERNALSITGQSPPGWYRR